MAGRVDIDGTMVILGANDGNSVVFVAFITGAVVTVSLIVVGPTDGASDFVTFMDGTAVGALVNGTSIGEGVTGRAIGLIGTVTGTAIGTGTGIKIVVGSEVGMDVGRRIGTGRGTCTGTLTGWDSGRGTGMGTGRMIKGPGALVDMGTVVRNGAEAGSLCAATKLKHGIFIHRSRSTSITDIMLTNVFCRTFSLYSNTSYFLLLKRLF
jgi:hypothetical protein